MKYRYLGHSGLLVSRVCLGTMTFGNSEWGCGKEDSVAVTRAFLDAGGNFIDSADMYSEGVSEEMLGAAIQGLPREDLVLATKCWFRSGRKGPNAKGLSRKHIIEACDASLRRMGIDYIDLYQVHGPDPHTPVDETMRALDDLVRTGRVRYIGCSNLYAWQILKANGTAERLGLERFISGQYMYNLIRRDVEREILPACEDQGMGLLCWSPLASGLLTGKYRGSDRPAEGTRIGIRAKVDMPRFWNEGSLSLVDRMADMAEELDKTIPQLGLSWLLRDRRVTSVIIGARTVTQTLDNLVSGDWDLPDNAWRELTDGLPLDLGYPKEWMDYTLPMTFGEEEFAPRWKQRLP